MSANWDSKHVQEYIKQEYGIEMTCSAIRAMLHRLGLSFTRPTYTLAKADAKAQEEFEEDLYWLLEMLEDPIINEEQYAVLFEDESHIRDYQALASTWQPVGKQKLIKTYGKHNYVGLFGALDYKTGQIIARVEEKLDAEAFKRHLESILKAYSGKHVYMVLDNAKIHYATLIQEFLAQHTKEITLMFLPTYSPKLNRIEGFWKWLKGDVICNVFFKSIKEVRKAVMEFVDWVLNRKDEVKARLCF